MTTASNPNPATADSGDLPDKLGPDAAESADPPVSTEIDLEPEWVNRVFPVKPPRKLTCWPKAQRELLPASIGQRELVTEPGGIRTNIRALVQRVKNRAVVVHLWRTACPPCEDELPLLNEFARQFNDVIDVFMIAQLTRSEVYGDADTAEDYQRTRAVDRWLREWLLLAEPGDIMPKNPTTYFLDTSGRVACIREGRLSDEEWRDSSDWAMMVRSILAKQRKP